MSSECRSYERSTSLLWAKATAPMGESYRSYGRWLSLLRAVIIIPTMQTTVSYADVTAVLVSAVENLILELQRGNQVEFGDLGKFRLQIVSDGADSAAEFKSDTHIKGVNIQYSPGPELYSVFQDMEFVQVASRAVQRAALKAEKEGAKTIDIEEAKKASSKKQNTSGGSSADGDQTSGGSTDVDM